MITIENCEKAGLHAHNNRFGLHNPHLRNDVPNELFISNDKRYLILCHSIHEGRMGSYFCQISIFENTENQVVKVNLSKSWFPMGWNHFRYVEHSQEFIATLTCHDRDSNTNHYPTIIIKIAEGQFTFLPKLVDYTKLNAADKDKLNRKILSGKDELGQDYIDHYVPKY